MKKIVLTLVSVAVAALLTLTACAPSWGTPGGGGMMGGQGGQGGGMMGNQGGGMMGGQDGQGGGMMGGQGGQGGGMMGGQGGDMMGGQGGDMMGGQDGQGGGMMGPGMMSGMPMMGGMMGYYPEVPIPFSPDQAKAIAGEYLASMNNSDLEIGEFEEYSHNFYVSLMEKSTGRGAVELIIDRYSGSYQPEPQGMMWNGKYGMMGGSQQAQMTVTPQQALKIAQDFLDVVYPETKADEIVPYYGYYTIMTTLEGEHYGMLSINGYSAEIWYHTWHGIFISEVE